VARFRLPSGGLWRHGDFMKLWSAETISQFGTAVSQLAIPLVAIVILKASAFEVALLGTIEFLPFLLFTLPAGVWVDRLPRRAILIAGDLGRAGLLATIPIAYAFDAITLWQLYVVGFFTGICTVFFDVAYQSYLPALVDRDALVEGNSKLEISRSGAQLAGPALAGGLIGLITAPYAILLDAISYVGSGAFVFRISKREQPRQREKGAPKPKMRHELSEGLRYVITHPYLRPQAMSTGTANFFTSLAFAIFLVFAVRELHMSAGLIGLAFGIGNTGWLLAALVTNRVQRRLGVGPTTVLGTTLTPIAGLLYAIAPASFPLPFLIGGGVLLGLGAVMYNITQVSLRQAITPERIQGRMNSVMRFIVWGTIPLGQLAGGVLGSTIGLRQTIFVGAAGSALAILPIVLSPIRSLREMPQPEEDVLPTIAAGEGALAPLPGGVDTGGATAGAGPAAATDR
jgi:MFS family permease